MLLDTIWNRLLDRLLREERGDGIISWVVLAVGLAAAAAAVIALLATGDHQRRPVDRQPDLRRLTRRR